MLFKKILCIFNIIGAVKERRIKKLTSPFGGVWTHLLVKRVDDTVYIYIDNVLVSSGILTNEPLELDSNNRIGLSLFNENAVLQGELKMFRFYNYAVDDTERTSIYNDN